MKIISDISENTKNIYVLGDLSKKAEKEIFLKSIWEHHFSEVNITFYDATILDHGVLENLMKLNDVTSSLNIFVSREYLYSYLNRLGFENIRHTNKTTNPIRVKHSAGEIYHKEGMGKNANSVEDEVIICFLGEIFERYGYNFLDYNLESVKRRIGVGMLKSQIEDPHLYFKIVLSNALAFEDLFLTLSINVTEFFRDAMTFKNVREKVLPYLETYPSLKIWCAGCSTGEEAYSLAIMLEEMDLLKKVVIYATDINPYVIQEAKNGFYSKANIEKSSNNYQEAGGNCQLIDYFDCHCGYYRVKKNIQENILFFEHSLLEKGVLNEFQLISCRNVLIYFNTNLKRDVLKLFHNSLDVSGFLLLGKSESVFVEEINEKYQVYDLESKVYKKAFSS